MLVLNCVRSFRRPALPGRREIGELASEKVVNERAIRKRSSALPRPLSGFCLGRFWRGYRLRTCTPDCTREISRNHVWKQKLNESVSFNYYFFVCTLKDTLTAKNGDVSSLTPQVRSESLICTNTTKPFHIGVFPPLPGFEHLLFKAVLRSVAPCQVNYSFNLSTKYLITEMLNIE